MRLLLVWLCVASAVYYRDTLGPGRRTIQCDTDLNLVPSVLWHGNATLAVGRDNRQAASVLLYRFRGQVVFCRAYQLVRLMSLLWDPELELLVGFFTVPLRERGPESGSFAVPEKRTVAAVFAARISLVDGAVAGPWRLDDEKYVTTPSGGTFSDDGSAVIIHCVVYGPVWHRSLMEHACVGPMPFRHSVKVNLIEPSLKVEDVCMDWACRRTEDAFCNFSGKPMQVIDHGDRLNGIRLYAVLGFLTIVLIVIAGYAI